MDLLTQDFITVIRQSTVPVETKSLQDAVREREIAGLSADMHLRFQRLSSATISVLPPMLDSMSAARCSASLRVWKGPAKTRCNPLGL